jgi:catechol 2,3-dioxygenase-like lactoylglutathione lyase family enzyme
MAGLRDGITQVSLAVRDLDGTVALYHRALGWAPGHVFDHVLPVQRDPVLPGREVHYALRVR